MKGVVEEIGFYTVKFQSDAELMNGLIKNDDLKQIVEELELKESPLKVFQDWQYDNWMKIYSSDPDKHKNLEASIVQFF